MHTVLLQMLAKGIEIAAIFVRHVESQAFKALLHRTQLECCGVQLVSGMPHLETFATTPETCKYISGDFQGAKPFESSTPDGEGEGA